MAVVVLGTALITVALGVGYVENRSELLLCKLVAPLLPPWLVCKLYPLSQSEATHKISTGSGGGGGVSSTPVPLLSS